MDRSLYRMRERFQVSKRSESQCGKFIRCMKALSVLDCWRVGWFLHNSLCYIHFSVRYFFSQETAALDVSLLLLMFCCVYRPEILSAHGNMLVQNQLLKYPWKCSEVGESIGRRNGWLSEKCEECCVDCSSSNLCRVFSIRAVSACG